VKVPVDVNGGNGFPRIALIGDRKATATVGPATVTPKSEQVCPAIGAAQIEFANALPLAFVAVSVLVRKLETVVGDVSSAGSVNCN
jgi:hypothetical protein